MKMITTNAKSVQLLKKKKLEREFRWISREFKSFSTLSDIEIYNVERYASLYLGYQF